MVLNSRPLTYLSADEVEEPLTPSHLLIGRRVLTLPDPTTDDDTSFDTDLSRKDLTRRMKHLSKTVDDFWRRWRAEYLLELRRQFQTPKGNRNTIRAGDIVIVHDENRLRGLWKLGRVRELIPGVDGNVRGTFVRVQSGGGHSTIKRPVQRLYPLEVRAEVMDSQEIVPTDEVSVNVSSKTTEKAELPARPRRQASLKARERVSKELNED